jgi:hypothetical protein
LFIGFKAKLPPLPTGQRPGKSFREGRTASISEALLAARSLGMGMNPEKVINQGGLRCTLFSEEFSDLELFDTAVPDSLPFVAYEQVPRLPIKDEVPAIHVRRSRASGAPVKLQLDCPHRHRSASVAFLNI